MTSGAQATCPQDSPLAASCALVATHTEVQKSQYAMQASEQYIDRVEPTKDELFQLHTQQLDAIEATFANFWN